MQANSAGNEARNSSELAASAGSTFTEAMTEYRAYFIDLDGHFAGFEPMNCADDAEAIERAKRLVARHGVELWSGTRLVIRIPRRAGH